MKTQEKVYCYFHNDDLDGWASSAVVKMKHPKAEFFGYNYELEFPLVEGYDIVYMVDCSTTSENMKALIEKNKKFVWIDHHAKKILDICKELGGEIAGIRDTNSKNAACVLTWRYLFPNQEVPIILNYIEDLDIWNWSLKHTDEINTALFIDYKNDRDKLVHFMNWSCEHDELIQNGKQYIKMRKSQIDFLLKLMRTKVFHGYKTGVVNTPIHTSFVGHEILEQNPDIDIALIWYNYKDYIKVSLRSRDEVDVSEIAHLYGGGGHKQASGFTLKTNDIKNRDIYLW